MDSITKVDVDTLWIRTVLSPDCIWMTMLSAFFLIDGD